MLVVPANLQHLHRLVSDIRALDVGLSDYYANLRVISPLLSAMLPLLHMWTAAASLLPRIERITSSPSIPLPLMNQEFCHSP